MTTQTATRPPQPTTATAPDPVIMLRKVRVAFPHLFKQPIINGQPSKCGAQLLLDPDLHKDTLAEIKSLMADLARDRLKGRMPAADRLCVRRGEDKGREEFEGYMVLSANSRTRPVVIRPDATVVAYKEGDNAEQALAESRIYPGAYVNAKVRLWVQDNQYGRRINAELVAIQFAADGEAFTSGSGMSEAQAVAGFDAHADGGADGFGAAAAFADADDDVPW